MTVKFIVLFRAAPGEIRETFRQSFANRTALALASRRTGLHRFVVNVLDVVPRRSGQAGQGSGEPPYDAMVEMWFDRADNGCSLLSEPGCVAAYRVLESIEKSEPAEDDASPRVKLFSFINPVAGLSNREFRRHWDEHVAIALRVHVACRQYVRHWVEESLPGDAPPATGIGMIAMRNQEDLELRMFDSPEGAAEVAADTAEFVGNRLVVYATEYCDMRIK